MFDITVAPADVSSTCKRQVAQYTGPNPYVAGSGDPVDPNDVRMGKIFAVLGNVALSGGVGILLFKWDPTDNVFYWFDLTGTEVANGTDLSDYAARVEVIGQ